MCASRAPAFIPAQRLFCPPSPWRKKSQRQSVTHRFRSGFEVMSRIGVAAGNSLEGAAFMRPD